MFTKDISKFNNPRRATQHMMQDIRNRLKTCIDRWNTASIVYEHSTDANGRSNAWTRKREAHEYPENNAREWASLYDQLGEIVRDAEAARAHALAQFLRCQTQQGVVS